jgi:hypothetical protein
LEKDCGKPEKIYKTAQKSAFYEGVYALILKENPFS